MRAFSAASAIGATDYTIAAATPFVVRIDFIRTLPDGSHASYAVTVDMRGKTNDEVADEATGRGFAAILGCWGWDDEAR